MGPTRRKTNFAAVFLMSLAVTFGGCGGGNASPAPPPVTPPAIAVTPDASVAGQYSLVLTSTTGHGMTAIYTDFTQTGKTFAGAGTTLVCPSNDPAQCEGSDPSADPIIPSGTVSGVNVTMAISFPTASGADSVTLKGATNGTTLVGTYTDSLDDTGAWTASLASSLGGDYSGNFNSTAKLMMIPASISLSLVQDYAFDLIGTATITSFPCISSLNLSGKSIGGAFTLTDSASKALIIAVPDSNGVRFNFSYKFDPTAASCGGDVGQGVLANNDPWGY